MPYIIAGISYADVDIKGGPIDGPEDGAYSKQYKGNVVGVGLEGAITNFLSLRIEFLETDFGSEDGNLSPGFPDVNMPVELETQSIQVGMSYNF